MSKSDFNCPKIQEILGFPAIRVCARNVIKGVSKGVTNYRIELAAAMFELHRCSIVTAIEPVGIDTQNAYFRNCTALRKRSYSWCGSVNREPTTQVSSLRP
jgi:hypothetical protein